MNYNIILFRCGFSPDNFKNCEHEPLITEKGTIYFFEQSTDDKVCPYCNSDSNVIIHDYYYTTINVTENSNHPEFIKIKKVRFKCKKCNVTFIKNINGVSKNETISLQLKRSIYCDFSKLLTFKQIANNYNVSITTPVNVFDELVPDIIRGKLPTILCIDEFKFSKLEDQKYCTVLTNFKNGKIIDILKNRKLDYLIEYFSSIDESERENVKYFVSDMYDQYAIIRKKFFPNAIHVIDLFHIVKQLTEAINQIRVITMKQLYPGSPQLYFFKKYWKYFLCSRYNIPYKSYTQKRTNITYDIHDLFYTCLKENKDLLEGYEILQELLSRFDLTDNLTVKLFMNKICESLELTGNYKLISVSKTYRKWFNEISNALLPETRKLKITNAKAEGNNNFIKTLIKISYGCNNFERTRKRILMIKK